MRNKIFKKSYLWLLLAISISFFSFKSILRPGYFPMHDDMQAMRVLQMDKCIKDGQIPCRWVPDMGYGYGYPQFNYYPPLPYYVMEVFHLLGLSILDSVKAGFVASFLLSSASMFFLGRSIFGNLGGFLSSVFYIYSPYRATNVYNRGAVGEFWALIFLPLIFWSILEIIRKKEKKYILYLALSYSGLLTTHLITSLIFSPVALLWAGFLLWHFGSRREVKRLIVGAVWGVLLAGFFVFPVVFEKKFAHTETLISGFFNYLAHFISLPQIFTSTHWGFGGSELGAYDDFSFSIGLLHWIFGLLALTVGWLNRKKDKFIYRASLFLVLITLGFLFMSHQKSAFIWKSVSLLSYLQFPWRFVNPATFSISLLVGAITHGLTKASSKILIALVAVAGVIFINAPYFYPREWYDISDREKFSGELWERQLTISIFDYLPIYAKFPPAKKAPETPEIVEGSVQVISGQKGTNWQRWAVDVVSDRATVRLPIYDFPGWKVWANSKEVSINHENELGLITFLLGGGESEIEARLTDTPIRRLGNLTTLASLVAIPVFFGPTRPRWKYFSK